MSPTIPGTMLLDPDVIEDPYPFYRRLHAEAPVWQVPETEVFVVSTQEMIAEAAARFTEFSSNMKHLLYKDARGLPGRMDFGIAETQTLATADPPIHTLHKRVVFPEFVGKRMSELKPDVETIVDRCVDTALAAGQVDFMDVIGNMVPIRVVSQLIGFKDSDPRRLMKSAFDSTDILSSTMSREELETAVSRNNDVSNWIAEQLFTAAKDPSAPDILCSIAKSMNDGLINAMSAIIMLHTLLAAGGESTTSLLGNAARLLAERQDIQRQLRADPGLIPSFVEEALRLESPFRFHMRLPNHDADLGGVRIPAGATMLMFWGAANRDPAEYERADELILDRAHRHSSIRHMAFGRGIHQCVGAPLARMEALVVFKTLLERTKSISLADDPPVRVNSLEVRRHATLPLELVAA